MNRRCCTCRGRRRGERERGGYMSQLLYTYHVHHHTCFSKHLPSLKFGENWDNSVSKGISTHITSPPTHPHTPLTYPGAFRVEVVVTIFRLRVEVHGRNVGLTVPCGCHGNTVLVQHCVKWVGGWSQKLLCSYVGLLIKLI